jgi:hypothetical protein
LAGAGSENKDNLLAGMEKGRNEFSINFMVSTNQKD